MEYDKGLAAGGRYIRRDLGFQVLKTINKFMRVVAVPGGIGGVGLSKDISDHARHLLRVVWIKPEMQVERASAMAVVIVAVGVIVFLVVVAMAGIAAVIVAMAVIVFFVFVMHVVRILLECAAFPERQEDEAVRC